MKYTKCILTLALVLALLCGCTQAPSQTAAVKSFGTGEMTEDARASKWFHIPAIEVAHGEDRVIEWEDAGMEARVRFWLGKPEGDILASDIWDIQVVHIGSPYDGGYDVVLEEVPEGYDCFSWDSIVWVQDNWRRIEEQDFPQIKSLADLRYFEGLQSLHISFTGWQEPVELDYSGLSECANLKAVTIENVCLDDLTTFTQVTELEYLNLSECTLPELSPLAQCTKVKTLNLTKCAVASFEAIADMPQLRNLMLFYSTYSDLEPLSKTNIEYLELGTAEDGRNDFDELNYEPLTRMEHLRNLDISNHSKFDLAVCTSVIENCRSLEYLDASLTEAAEEIKAGGTLDVSALKGFDCKPYSN